MTRKETLAYAAGIIDGEGSIILKKKRGRSWCGPSITVASTSMELLLWLQDAFGGYIWEKKETRPNRKKGWTWGLSTGATIKLLPHLYPYIRENAKRARVHYIMQNYTLAKSSGSWGDFIDGFYDLTPEVEIFNRDPGFVIK